MQMCLTLVKVMMDIQEDLVVENTLVRPESSISNSNNDKKLVNRPKSIVEAVTARVNIL